VNDTNFIAYEMQINKINNSVIVMEMEEMNERFDNVMKEMNEPFDVRHLCFVEMLIYEVYYYYNFEMWFHINFFVRLNCMFCVLNCGL